MLMGAILVALLVAFVPTRNFNWFVTADPWSPAICYFAADTSSSIDGFPSPPAYKGKATPAFQSMLFSMALLIYGTFSRCTKIFTHVSMTLRSAIRRPISRVIQKPVRWVISHGKRRSNASSIHFKRRREFWFYLIQCPVMASFYTLRFLADFLGSMYFEVCLSHLGQGWNLTTRQLFGLVWTLTWGSLKVLAARDSLRGGAGKPFDPSERFASALSHRIDEDQWSFGQVLSVLLLVMPLWNLIERLVSAVKEETKCIPQGAATQSPAGCLFEEIPSPASDNPSSLSSNHFTTVSGLCPCIFGAAFITWLFAIRFMINVSGDSASQLYVDFALTGLSGSILNYWIYSDGALIIVVLGLPLSCFIVFTIGLSLDPWLRRPIRPHAILLHEAVFQPKKFVHSGDLLADGSFLTHTGQVFGMRFVADDAESMTSWCQRLTTTINKGCERALFNKESTWALHSSAVDKCSRTYMQAAFDFTFSFRPMCSRSRRRARDGRRATLEAPDHPLRPTTPKLPDREVRQAAGTDRLAVDRSHAVYKSRDPSTPNLAETGHGRAELLRRQGLRSDGLDAFEGIAGIMIDSSEDVHTYKDRPRQSIDKNRAIEAEGLAEIEHLKQKS
ncbi:hypothetical protein XA68_15815 [Ophiocordyceps unilateralis]|uniref:PH domain-containing protein n=1 Tax=Ophiocordyceps unilateralis TaxID=268505 RepID=A0A2A9P6C9_OPHUN|nr:hypothetical protein XA68_15815 [Ophiocordyceps unilateralis]